MKVDEEQLLIQIHNETRAEIRVRLQRQSDFFIQMMVVLAIILTLALSVKIGTILLLLPFVSLFYTMMILSNNLYIHELGKYLRLRIEPRMGQISGIEKSLMWENYIHKEGIFNRKWLHGAPVYMFIPIALIPIFVIFGIDNLNNIDIVIAVLAVYLLLVIAMTYVAVSEWRNRIKSHEAEAKEGKL